MFIGHYGVALAAKRVSPSLSLGWPFLAVQLLDVLFSIFVLAGVEKLRIVHGFTAYNPYDLYFMPYTHSLVGALIWSVAAGLMAAAFAPRGVKRVAAAALAVAVFSHFVLDLPMHTPDMPLGFAANSPKLGLGLWNYRTLAILAEVVAFAVGAFVYWRAFRPRRAVVIFLGVLFALTLATPFFPDPPNERAFAIQAVVGYLLLAVVAHFVDRGQQLR
jgi:hypothetical protein